MHLRHAAQPNALQIRLCKFRELLYRQRAGMIQDVDLTARPERIRHGGHGALGTANCIARGQFMIDAYLHFPEGSQRYRRVIL